ncbi:uncharacterized protein [Anabrus simplex]|uniref:uncharacterized protein n=1 Tax=Anabrus simplex TaxID=316456 RepID=UPI0035A286BC
MEEPVFVKCEPAWSSDTEEPSNAENLEFVSEVIPMEQEIKSELTVPGPTQENKFKPSADIKEEVFVEQHQLFPNITEENNSMNGGFDLEYDFGWCLIKDRLNQMEPMNMLWTNIHVANLKQLVGVIFM